MEAVRLGMKNKDKIDFRKLKIARTFAYFQDEMKPALFPLNSDKPVKVFESWERFMDWLESDLYEDWMKPFLAEGVVIVSYRGTMCWRLQ